MQKHAIGAPQTYPTQSDYVHSKYNAGVEDFIDPDQICSNSSSSGRVIVKNYKKGKTDKRSKM